MNWFRENWYEDVLRRMKRALTLAYAAAFETRSQVAKAGISPDLLAFVSKVVETFGKGLGRCILPFPSPSH